MSQRDRIAKWDNLKGILIFLVVLGHCIYVLTKDESALRMRMLYGFIYMFHMPLFVFISGVFSQRMIDTGRHLKKRVTGYIILGFLLKFYQITIELLFGKFSSFSLFKESGVPWYLFCLAAYLVLTRALRDMPRRTLLVLSLVFALFVGYDKSIANWLTLSRFFVFYPYFLMGTLWDAGRVEPEKNRLFWKLGALAVLAAAGLIIVRNITWLYPYIELAKGWKSYIKLGSLVGEEKIVWGALLRLIYYVAALLMSAAVFILVPSRPTPWAVLGQRTLAIYFFHRPILYIMQYTSVREFLKQLYPPHWRVLYLVLGTSLTFVFALPVFTRILDVFWRQIGMEEDRDLPKKA